MPQVLNHVKGKKMKKYKGKAIYQPDGRAGEYSRWACNLHNGCSNCCTYCFLKKGVWAGRLGIEVPELQAPFINNVAAYKIFRRELMRHRGQIIKDGGITFCYTTDPCLLKPVNTFKLYYACAMCCLKAGVPVTLLTKCTSWIYTEKGEKLLAAGGKRLCVGFSLTGQDRKEPFADTNWRRIQAMRYAKSKGCHTFASIEPVIDFDASRKMIESTIGFCDLYKIGLLQHCNIVFRRTDLSMFIIDVAEIASRNPSAVVYWKESCRKLYGSDIEGSQFANDYYNIFAEDIMNVERKENATQQDFFQSSI